MSDVFFAASKFSRFLRNRGNAKIWQRLKFQLCTNLYLCCYCSIANCAEVIHLLTAHCLETNRSQTLGKVSRVLTETQTHDVKLQLVSNTVSPCNRVQVRENMLATGAKCGKTCKRWQAWENMQLVSSAGKHATPKCKMQNMHPVPSTGKRANGTKRGKARNRCQMRKNMHQVAVLIAGKHM